MRDDNVLIAQIRKNEGDEAADAAAKLYCKSRCDCSPLNRGGQHHESCATQAVASSHPGGVGVSEKEQEQ